MVTLVPAEEQQTSSWGVRAYGEKFNTGMYVHTSAHVRLWGRRGCGEP